MQGSLIQGGSDPFEPGVKPEISGMRAGMNALRLTCTLVNVQKDVAGIKSPSQQGVVMVLARLSSSKATVVVHAHAGVVSRLRALAFRKGGGHARATGTGKKHQQHQEVTSEASWKQKEDDHDGM